MKRKPSQANVPWHIWIRMISWIVVGVCFALLYLLVGDHIKKSFTDDSISMEEIERRAYNRAISAEEQQRLSNKVVNGIHVQSGMYADPNLPTVISACTSCHSSKLVTQNRATRDGWQQMISWMQTTQGLPDLGTQEPIILDYLAKYYAPTKEGRRSNLEIEATEWYVLEINE